MRKWTLPQPTGHAFALLDVDRRLASRVATDRFASCSPQPWSELAWARLRDLSRTGVGLLSSVPFETGTPILLRLQSRSDSRAAAYTARVVHCGLHYSGYWIVGCRFDHELTPDKLNALT